MALSVNDQKILDDMKIQLAQITGSDIGDLTVFVDGKTTNEECPENNTDNCECGGALSGEYGFTPYGLGLHMTCTDCCTVYNFIEDIEE